MIGSNSLPPESGQSYGCTLASLVSCRASVDFTDHSAGNGVAYLVYDGESPMTCRIRDPHTYEFVRRSTPGFP